MHLTHHRFLLRLFASANECAVFLFASWIALDLAHPDAVLLGIVLLSDLDALELAVLLPLMGASVGPLLHEREWRTRAPLARAGEIVRWSLVVTAVVTGAGVLLDLENFSNRRFLLAFSPSLLLLRLASEASSKVLLVALRRRGRNLRHVVIVGSGARAEHVVETIVSRPAYGYHVEGYVDDYYSGSRLTIPRLAELKGFPEVLARRPVDEVFVTLPIRSCYDQILAIIGICEVQGIAVNLAADFFTVAIAESKAGEFGEVPVLSLVSSGPMEGAGYLCKRCIDFAGAALLVILLAPVMLATACAIRISMGSPILFTQPRVGHRRRIFTMYKFRTMTVDAEARLPELEARNEMNGPLFKIRDDPRVTRLGALLRRTSLDEFPQIFNVLRGNMSLVGPRPLPRRDVQLFDSPSLQRRFAVPPGITCLWQVSGRSELGFEDWVRLDLEYVDTWSLRKDLLILARTVPAVVFARGAQ